MRISTGNSIIPTEAEHDAHYCHEAICTNCEEKFTPEEDEELCVECQIEADEELEG